MNPIRTVLLSFVGNRDPYNESEHTAVPDSGGQIEAEEAYGPVLSLLQVRTFDEVILFCTGGDYLERARQVEQIYREGGGKSHFTHHLLQLSSVVDYEEIYKKLSEAFDTLGLLADDETGKKLYILLDPGTPQIQTCWFLLARSGELPATLLQGVPPQFGGGSYRVREIDLDSLDLPRVISHEGSEDTSVDLSLSFILHGLERDKPISDFSVQALLESNKSEFFLESVRKALLVARYSDVSVVLRGEPGTGKELLARLIHEKSPRNHNPFVAINCSALSPHLVESELFGHMKGAFTGAAKDRIGKFRAADGGTILLDEIGDLPLEIQPKLLRVLQEKTVQPVGSDREYRVDVRVLAATNRDLEAMLAKGTFRRDLYDRLSQVMIQLPPLRSRKADIPLLARKFLEEWNRKYDESKFLSREVLDIFYQYSWPGNVRELQNTIIALCASSKSDELKPECLPPPLRASSYSSNHSFPFWAQIPVEGINLKALLYQAERSFFAEALRRTKGNREKAAQLLGLNPPAFRKALKERFPDLLSEQEVGEETL